MQTSLLNKYPYYLRSTIGHRQSVRPRASPPSPDGENSQLAEHSGLVPAGIQKCPKVGT